MRKFIIEPSTLNGRFHEHKDLNHEKCQTFSLDREVSIKLNDKTWDIITKKEHMRAYTWTKYLADLLSEHIPSCCLNFKRRKLYPEKSKYIIKISVLPNFHFVTAVKLATCEITTESILNILIGLNANKAHGPDDISVKMIKLCPNALCAPLNLIFNNILATGIYPDQWKMANVTPVHKKDNKQVINNYRPISLLPIFAKVFEKIIFKNLYNHLVSNNLITNNQSGFRPGDSVTNQLTYLVNEIF